MLYCPICGNHKFLKKDGFTRAGTQLYYCKKCKKGTTTPGGLEHVDTTFDRKKVESHVNSKCELYAIVAAQNATPVNEPYFNSLLQYCKHNNAKLIVIPYRYRNPTSVFSDKDQDWWDEKLVPYIADTRFKITDNLWVMGDIKIQPTATRPLSGLDTMTGVESSIFGHPKMQLKSIATAPGDMAKLISTTGSVTIPNYTNSKAGKKGQHHHSFSAVIVEKDKELFHLRHVTACEDGSFIDLDKEYFPDKVRKAEKAQGLVLGDLHHMFLDRNVENAVFGKDGIVKTLKPENIVFHDVIDSYSISHHHKGNPFLRYMKNKSGIDNVKNELYNVIEYLKEKTKFGNIILVSSNHNDHISRWLMETDWRSDLVNAEFYLETALHIIKNTTIERNGVNTPNAFEYWVKKEIPEITFISDKNGQKIGDFETGFHGHVGPNGSRGSLLSLSKIGNKVIVGHSHTPGREDGSMCVGTSSILDMGYVNGPSSWLHTHAVVYANGKGTLINVVKGKWRK